MVPEAEVNELENRLATHAIYDDGNKRLLEQLLTGNEELRKNNASLELENQRLQHTLDLDLRRHKEVNKIEHFSDMYDWIVNIQLLSDVSKEVGHPLQRPAPSAPLSPHAPRLARPAARPPRSVSVLRGRASPCTGMAHRVLRDVSARARLDAAGASPVGQGMVHERWQGQARGDAPPDTAAARWRAGVLHAGCAISRLAACSTRHRPSAGAALSWRCLVSMTRARLSS